MIWKDNHLDRYGAPDAPEVNRYIIGNRQCDDNGCTFIKTESEKRQLNTWNSYYHNVSTEYDCRTNCDKSGCDTYQYNPNKRACFHKSSRDQI